VTQWYTSASTAGCQNSNAKQKARRGKLQKRLNCVQINLQHSRLATDNLLKIIEESTDILCIQEPFRVTQEECARLREGVP